MGLSKFATVIASHFPPRAVAMPRALKAAAIRRSDFAPLASALAGATASACATAPTLWAELATAPASASLGLPSV